ncbi:hypothetical protein Tco_1380787 [Tanacetum coccineum]
MVQRDRRAPHNAMPTTAFESIFNNQDIIPKSRTKKRKFEMTETKALATAVEETLICSNIETNTHSKLKILLSDQPLDQAPKEQVSASWLLCMLAFMVASTFFKVKRSVKGEAAASGKQTETIFASVSYK